jgi:hypothetical protein
MFSGYLVTTAWCVSRISDGGDDLQMWKAAGNTVIKRLRTADIGRSGWRMGVEFKTPHGKRVSMLQNATQGTERDELYRILSFRI